MELSTHVSGEGRLTSPLTLTMFHGNVVTGKEISMDQGQTRKLSVEVGEKEGEGIYSNFVLITHNPSEFLLDFARVMPGVPKAKVYARILMNPQHAKSLEKVLSENIKKYESRFGKITVQGQEEEERNIGFQLGGKPGE